MSGARGQGVRRAGGEVSSGPRTGRLSVFGVGPKGLAQMSIESLELMKQCDRLVGATLFNAQLDAFCRTFKAVFEPMDWGRAYVTSRVKGALTRPGLAGIQQAVEDHLRAGLHVGLIVEGDPSVFSFASDLMQECATRGHACRSYGAVGSLGQILALLQPLVGKQLERGFSVYSALSPGLAATRFNRDLGLLIYNMGHLHKQEPKAFEALLRVLGRLCGRQQRLHLVEITPGEDNVRSCALGELPAQMRLIGINFTLFIPASDHG